MNLVEAVVNLQLKTKQVCLTMYQRPIQLYSLVSGLYCTA